MKSGRFKKTKSINDFLFFFGFVMIIIPFFISFVTLKNECIFLKNEISHIEQIKNIHLNKVEVLRGVVKNLSLQDRIEKVVKEKFEMYIPTPESLIVYIED